MCVSPASLADIGGDRCRCDSPPTTGLAGPLLWSCFGLALVLQRPLECPLQCPLPLSTGERLLESYCKRRCKGLCYVFRTLRFWPGLREIVHINSKGLSSSRHCTAYICILSMPVDLMANLNSNWLTANEAADYLRIKPATLLLWARQGKVRGCVLSGTHRHVWRFQTSDLDATLVTPSIAHRERP
jgi:hypothetical protein